MKKLITFLVIALIFTSLGVYISPWITQKLNVKAPTQVTEKTFEDGWNAARQRLIDNGYMPKKEQENLTPNTVNGIIVAINSGGTLDLNTNSSNLLIDPNLKVRTIQLNDSLEIEKKKLATTSSGELITGLSIQNFEIGQSIEVSSDQDISQQSTILPKKITIYDFSELKNIPISE